MNSLIMQPAFKRVITSLLIGAIGILVSSCAETPQPPPIPDMSQLQIREMQTREYQDTDVKQVLKALLAALLDEGYIVNEVQPELGIVSAARELYDVDKATKNIAEMNFGSGAGTYQTTKRFECSALVSEYGDLIRVRINIVAKAVSNSGGNIWSQPVYDLNTYQNLFSKMSKALFLEKEKI